MKSYIKEKGKVLCNKCNQEERLPYHSYCQKCYNEYMKEYAAKTREKENNIFGTQALYRIDDIQKGVPVYIGSTSQPKERHKKHFYTKKQTRFASMINDNHLDINNYRMYILDLEKLSLSERERIALEHEQSYIHRATIINTDIEVNKNDITILEDIHSNKQELIDSLEWELYSDYIERKQKNSPSLLVVMKEPKKEK